MASSAFDPAQALARIPGILSVEPLRLSEKTKEGLEEGEIGPAQALSGRILGFRIRYLSQGKSLSAFWAQPQGEGPFPAVLLCRGGSGDFGKWESIDLFRPGSMLAALAGAGYAVAAPQYPGVDGGEGQDALGSEADLASVLDLHPILMNCPWILSDRIGLYGFSRGGMAVYQALAQSHWPKAAVVAAGLADAVGLDRFRPGFAEYQAQMHGPSLEEKQKRSALCWPQKLRHSPPILLLHGTADDRVDPQDSVRMAQELLKLGVPHKLKLFEGAGHDPSPFQKEAQRLTLEWFDRYLKGEDSSGQA